MHMTEHRDNNRKPVGQGPAWRGRAVQLTLLLLASFACSLTAVEANAQQRAPELLTYDELVQQGCFFGFGQEVGAVAETFG